MVSRLFINDNPSPFPLHLLKNAIHQSGPAVSNYEDDDYNLRNFDYSKKICRSDFKYSWNTHRDLILSGGSYDFEQILRNNPYLFNSIVRSATINRASAPNCKIVFVFFNSKHIDIFTKRVSNINVTIYEDNSTNSAPNREFGVINRFHFFRKYLTAHRTEFDRVFFCDSRDVVMFRDAFGTFDNEMVHFVAECHSNLTGSCNTFGNSQILRSWIGFYGHQVALKFARQNWMALNAGIFYGGITPMIEVLAILATETKRLNKLVWGADMAVLNYCYYMGLFAHIKIAFHTCSNLVCFGPSDIHYFPQKKSLYQYVNGKLQCAPIIIHGGEYLKRQFPVFHSN